MKKLFTSLFALALMTTANAQMIQDATARVYAYGLTQTDGDNITVAFKTNTKAETAKVILFAEGYDNVEVTATSTDGKNWTATVEPSKAFTANVDYNWKAEVSAAPVTAWTRISDNENSDKFSLFRSYGIAVDKAPESDNFGRIYAANNKGGETTSADDNGSINRNTAIGIYTYQPDLTAENGATPYSCDVVGDGSQSGGSPRDMVVGPDGKLYLADYTAATSGIYVVDPTDNFSHTAIFEGTRDDNGYIKNNNSEIISGKVFGIGVLGTGDDREIYAIGYEGDAGSVARAYRYDIGAANTWTSVPSYSDYNFSLNGILVRMYFSNCAIEPISTGGYWISQNRGATSTGEPSLMYFDNNNNLVLTLEGLGVEGTSSKNGALAVDERTKTIAFANAGNARFVKYNVDENDNVTVDINTIVAYPMTMQGSSSNAFDFDYAGNLYSVTSGAELMAVFAVPDAVMGENTCATPAKKEYTVSFSQADIEATSIQDINADANAPVEYYNLQGVKVDNPSNGIFIKKQGNKTAKVVL